MQYLNLVFRFPQRNQTQFSQPISDHGYLALCVLCLSAKDIRKFELEHIIYGIFTNSRQ